MNRIRESRVFHGVLWVALLLFVAGCTVASGVALKPQSHFSYPNSNVVPLGRVQGEASVTTILTPTIMDADLEDEAIQKALSQKGGEILIDYTLTTQIKFIPIPIFPIYITTYRVDGTAAKMTIGKQKLR